MLRVHQRWREGTGDRPTPVRSPREPAIAGSGAGPSEIEGARGRNQIECRVFETSEHQPEGNRSTFMANIRSAEKQRRQAEKANARNRAGKSRLRSALKKTRAPVAEGDTSMEVISSGFSEIDKPANRGIIKDNTADPYKSRLAASV